MLREEDLSSYFANLRRLSCFSAFPRNADEWRLCPGSYLAVISEMMSLYIMPAQSFETRKVASRA
jgi:hypothetical protein